MKSALKFRNVDASPSDAVETWPFEGVVAAIERGTLPDWRRLAAAIYADPWGDVAAQVLEAIRLSDTYGVNVLMDMIVSDARSRAEQAERAEVADEIKSLVKQSGLTRREFAKRVGTSTSRLSTYITGAVTPSASLVVRMRRISASEGALAHRDRELGHVAPTEAHRNADRAIAPEDV